MKHKALHLRRVLYLAKQLKLMELADTISILVGIGFFMPTPPEFNLLMESITSFHSFVELGNRAKCFSAEAK